MACDPEFPVLNQAAWDAARCGLDGLPGAMGLNMAHEAVDRHAAGPLADRTAIRWRGPGGATIDLSYRQLAELSARFANILAHLGIQRGETVCTLADRVPALYVAALGSDTFDVTTLNSATVKFGKTGTEVSPVRAPLIRDLNGDGKFDAMYGFMTFDCGFAMGDTTGILKGKLNDGIDAEGKDSVLVSP